MSIWRKGPERKRVLIDDVHGMGCSQLHLRHRWETAAMTGGRRLLIAGAAVVLVAAGGVGIAQAVSGDSDEQATGPDADRAKRAAVEAIGGARAAGVERGDDGHATWEVEVIRPDGSEVEVTVTSDLKQIGTEAEDDGAETEDESKAEDDEN
jgi:hypothetical protein